MSECGVCLASYDGSSEFCHSEIRKARKDYICCECGKPIKRGERHAYAAGKSDGDLWSARTCLICDEIADAFFCDGRTYGGVLWEYMDEVWDQITTGCFTKLQTAAAKAELQRRWNEWKFSS